MGVLLTQGEQVPPVEGRAAGEALVEGGGGRVDVAGRARRGARPLLGGHVAGSAGDAGPGALTHRHGDAEIGQFAGALGRDQDVLRFVVAVHDAPGVRRAEPRQRALEDAERRLRRRRSVRAQQLPQRHAVDQFHDDRRAAGRLDVLVEAGDVRVVDAGQQPGLGAERGAERRVVTDAAGEVLDRHRGAGRLVHGEVHPAGRAGAELPHRAVAGDLPAGHASTSPLRGRWGRPRSPLWSREPARPSAQRLLPAPGRPGRPGGWRHGRLRTHVTGTTRRQPHRATALPAGPAGLGCRPWAARRLPRQRPVGR